MLKLCSDCGTDISARGVRAKRCQECADKVEAIQMAQADKIRNLKKRMQQIKKRNDFLKKEIGSTIGEYLCQSIMPGGYIFLHGISYRRKAECRDCGVTRPDCGFAPAFNEVDAFDCEREIIILCVSCYTERQNSYLVEYHRPKLARENEQRNRVE